MVRPSSRSGLGSWTPARAGRSPRAWPHPVARFATVMIAALAFVAGCSASPAPAPRPESPFAACPPSDATPASAPSDPLPAVTLPCFTGDAPVALHRLGQPAVINLWASWCFPCREELPALQAFAEEVGDRALVLGVVTDDPWERAAWAGADFGARYPNVYDPDRTLARALGRPNLPTTLFVAADGSVRATDVSGKLTLEKLRALAATHLGVAV